MSDAHYEVREAIDGSYFYALVAANGETLVTSETYTRRADAERAIGDAQTAAHEAEHRKREPL